MDAAGTHEARGAEGRHPPQQRRSTSRTSCRGWRARRSRSRTCRTTAGGSRSSTTASGSRPRYPSTSSTTDARVRALAASPRGREGAAGVGQARAPPRAACGSRRSPRRARSTARPARRGRAPRGPGHGQATLRLLGWEDQVNQPARAERCQPRPGRAAAVSASTTSVWTARASCRRPRCCSAAARSGTSSQARALGVLHGPAGSGKTFAAQLAVADRSRLHGRGCSSPSRPTMLHVARRLYRELDRRRARPREPVRSLRGADRACSPTGSGCWSSTRRSGSTASASSICATCTTMPERGSRCCWSAVTGAGECSRASRCSARRIHRRVRFAPMPPAMVLQVIRGYHPIYERAPTALLVLIDDCYAHGCFARGRALPTARSRCAANATPRCCPRSWSARCWSCTRGARSTRSRDELADPDRSR